MKKIAAAMILTLFTAGFALALDFEVSGEVKTGFYSERRQVNDDVFTTTKIHNNDGDSGSNEGRFRFAMSLTDEFFGLKARFSQKEFRPDNHFQVDLFYVYGNLLNNQLKISAGLLDDNSPWGTGGPELIQTVETDRMNEMILGIRTEWKPAFIPGLNVGFVLNRFDERPTPPTDHWERFYDILLDSVLGIAYEHEYFAFRFSYRFDTEADWGFTGNEGSRFVYRVEERILGKILPGMQIWANGYRFGINATHEENEDFQNWVHILYDPETFMAGLDIRYINTIKHGVQSVRLRPSFMYRFFNNFLNLGLIFELDFGVGGSKLFDDTFYSYWALRPYLRVNINNSAYAAIFYNYQVGAFEGFTPSKDQTTHWLNLRLCYSF